MFEMHVVLESDRFVLSINEYGLARTLFDKRDNVTVGINQQIFSYRNTPVQKQ